MRFYFMSAVCFSALVILVSVNDAIGQTQQSVQQSVQQTSQSSGGIGGSQSTGYTGGYQNTGYAGGNQQGYGTSNSPIGSAYVDLQQGWGGAAYQQGDYQSQYKQLSENVVKQLFEGNDFQLVGKLLFDSSLNTIGENLNLLLGNAPALILAKFRPYFNVLAKIFSPYSISQFPIPQDSPYADSYPEFLQGIYQGGSYGQYASGQYPGTVNQDWYKYNDAYQSQQGGYQQGGNGYQQGGYGNQGGVYNQQNVQQNVQQVGGNGQNNQQIAQQNVQQAGGNGNQQIVQQTAQQTGGDGNQQIVQQTAQQTGGDGNQQIVQQTTQQAGGNGNQQLAQQNVQQLGGYGQGDPLAFMRFIDSQANIPFLPPQTYKK